MSFRDSWHSALVYFGLAEEYHDDYDDEPAPEAEIEDRYRERPNVRRLRRRRDEFDDIFGDDDAADAGAGGRRGRSTTVLKPVGSRGNEYAMSPSGQYCSIRAPAFQTRECNSRLDIVKSLFSDLRHRSRYVSSRRRPTSPCLAGNYIPLYSASGFAYLNSMVRRDTSCFRCRELIRPIRRQPAVGLSLY